MRLAVPMLLLASVLGSIALDADWAEQPALIPGNFADVTSKLGIHFRNISPHTSKKYLIETMGGGVALFDYDNDGRLDIFFVNGAPLSDPTPKGAIPQKSSPEYWNRLFHKKPAWRARVSAWASPSETMTMTATKTSTLQLLAATGSTTTTATAPSRT